jgi:hypothetical protein
VSFDQKRINPVRLGCGIAACLNFTANEMQGAFSDAGWSELITCSAENLLGATALVNASLDRMTDSSAKPETQQKRKLGSEISYRSSPIGCLR